MIDDESSREKAQGDGGPRDPEERKLAEDKKKNFVKKETQRVVKVPNPMAINEGRNQVSPSDPQHRLLHAPSTLRSTAQRLRSMRRENGRR